MRAAPGPPFLGANAAEPCPLPAGERRLSHQAGEFLDLSGRRAVLHSAIKDHKLPNNTVQLGSIEKIEKNIEVD
jgi:hypothetical protein